MVEAGYSQAPWRGQLIILPRFLCSFTVGVVVETVIVLHSRSEISTGSVERLRKLLYIWQVLLASTVGHGESLVEWSVRDSDQVGHLVKEDRAPETEMFYTSTHTENSSRSRGKPTTYIASGLWG